MRKSRFSEEQIISVLREQGAGLSTAEVWPRLRELAPEQRRFGYRRLHILLRAEARF